MTVPAPPPAHTSSWAKPCTHHSVGASACIRVQRSPSYQRISSWLGLPRSPPTAYRSPARTGGARAAGCASDPAIGPEEDLGPLDDLLDDLTRTVWPGVVGTDGQR